MPRDGFVFACRAQGGRVNTVKHFSRKSPLAVGPQSSVSCSENCAAWMQILRLQSAVCCVLHTDMDRPLSGVWRPNQFNSRSQVVLSRCLSNTHTQITHTQITQMASDHCSCIVKITAAAAAAFVNQMESNEQASKQHELQ